MVELEDESFPWDADLQDFHDGPNSLSNNSFSVSLLNPRNWKRVLVAFILIAIPDRSVTH
jgi:hypothetical protein